MTTHNEFENKRKEAINDIKSLKNTLTQKIDNAYQNGNNIVDKCNNLVKKCNDIIQDANNLEQTIRSDDNCSDKQGECDYCQDVIDTSLKIATSRNELMVCNPWHTYMGGIFNETSRSADTTVNSFFNGINSFEAPSLFTLDDSQYNEMLSFINTHKIQLNSLINNIDSIYSNWENSNNPWDKDRNSIVTKLNNAYTKLKNTHKLNHVEPITINISNYAASKYQSDGYIEYSGNRSKPSSNSIDTLLNGTDNGHKNVLHSYTTNRPSSALYSHLGFENSKRKYREISSVKSIGHKWMQRKTIKIFVYARVSWTDDDDNYHSETFERDSKFDTDLDMRDNLDDTYTKYLIDQHFKECLDRINKDVKSAVPGFKEDFTEGDFTRKESESYTGINVDFRASRNLTYAESFVGNFSYITSTGTEETEISVSNNTKKPDLPSGFSFDDEYGTRTINITNSMNNISCTEYITSYWFRDDAGFYRSDTYNNDLVCSTQEKNDDNSTTNKYFYEIESAISCCLSSCVIKKQFTANVTSKDGSKYTVLEGEKNVTEEILPSENIVSNNHYTTSIESKIDTYISDVKNEINNKFAIGVYGGNQYYLDSFERTYTSNGNIIAFNLKYVRDKEDEESEILSTYLKYGLNEELGFNEDNCLITCLTGTYDTLKSISSLNDVPVGSYDGYTGKWEPDESKYSAYHKVNETFIYNLEKGVLVNFISMMGDGITPEQSDIYTKGEIITPPPYIEKYENKPKYVFHKLENGKINEKYSETQYIKFAEPFDFSPDNPTNIHSVLYHDILVKVETYNLYDENNNLIGTETANDSFTLKADYPGELYSSELAKHYDDFLDSIDDYYQENKRFICHDGKMFEFVNNSLGVGSDKSYYREEQRRFEESSVDFKLNKSIIIEGRRSDYHCPYKFMIDSVNDVEYSGGSGAAGYSVVEYYYKDENGNDVKIPSATKYGNKESEDVSEFASSVDFIFGTKITLPSETEISTTTGGVNVTLHITGWKGDDGNTYDPGATVDLYDYCHAILGDEHDGKCDDPNCSYFYFEAIGSVSID